MPDVRQLAFPAPPSIVPATDADPVRALERELAEHLDLAPDHVAALADASEAYRGLIEASVGALPDAADDTEMIVPALLGDPAAAAGLALGLPVVPSEVDGSTAAISPQGLRNALGERPAVVVAEHPFGHPAPLDDLVRLVDGLPVVLVEDASDALGASLRGVPAGRMAEGAVVALSPGRSLTGGASATGALLVLRDAGRAAAVRASSAPLPEDTAGIALAELRNLDEDLEVRRQLAWELTLNLRGSRALVPMPHGRWIRHAYSRYVVRIRSLLWKRSLEETVAALRDEGIPCEPACPPPLHLDAALSPRLHAALPGDARLDPSRFTAATSLTGELIAIPLHTGLTSRDMADLARVLRHLEERST